MLERIGVLYSKKQILAAGSWKEAVRSPDVLPHLDLAKIKARRRMANLGYKSNKY